MDPDSIARSYRMVVIGSSGVGKSALLAQFVHGEFIDSFISTIGVDFGFKKTTILLPNSATCVLSLRIFDTAGQERFQGITDYYQRLDTQGILVVFDVTDKSSLFHAEELIQRARKLSPLGRNLPMLLVGNKIDLTQKRCISKEDGEALAGSVECPYLETSAKDNKSTCTAFVTLAKLILESEAFPFPPETSADPPVSPSPISPWVERIQRFLEKFLLCRVR